jgi:hypothetical protein
MKFVLSIIAAIIVIALSYVVGWGVERWINWKLGYSKDVSSEIQPLIDRLDDLERRIEVIESGRHQ